MDMLSRLSLLLLPLLVSTSHCGSDSASGRRVDNWAPSPEMPLLAAQESRPGGIDATRPPRVSTSAPSDTNKRDARCRTVKDFEGNDTCADPRGYDNGFVDATHPCPSALPLPGARPVRVRYIAMGNEYGLIGDDGGCKFPGGTLQSKADFDAMRGRVSNECWNMSLEALSRVDYARFEAVISHHSDHDGSLIRFDDGKKIYEVQGGRACKGTAPMGYTSILVRPKSSQPVVRQQCPERPCMAP